MSQSLKAPPPFPAPGGFGIYAAWLGIATPLLAVGIAAGTGYWMQQRGASVEETKAVFGILGMLAFGFTLLGFSCSLVSFFGKGDRHGNGLVALGVLGLALNGGLIGTGTVSGLRAVKARSLAEMQAAIDENNARLKQDFAEDGSIDFDPSRAERMRQVLDKVGNSGNGLDAHIARTMREFLDDLEKLAAQHKQRSDTLLGADPMNPLTLKTKADLQMRRSLLAELNRSNEALASYIKNAPAMFEEKLTAGGVSESNAKKFVEGFASKQELLLKIRDCDRRMAEGMSAALTLTEQHWEQWQADEQGAFAGFSDAAATTEYFRLVELIQTTGSEQVELQGQYLKEL